MREGVNWDASPGQRKLRSKFRIRMSVNKVPRPGSRKVLQVASIRLALFHDNAVVYKKMKRLNVE